MSNHNYSKYSNKNFTEPEMTVTETSVKMEDEVVECSAVNEVATVQVMQMSPVEDATPEVSEEPVPEIPAVGKVVDCSRLNVRAKPSTDASVISTLPVNTEVEIDTTKSTDEWYCVFINNGNATGYCMKKFISVNV